MSAAAATRSPQRAGELRARAGLLPRLVLDAREAAHLAGAPSATFTVAATDAARATLTVGGDASLYDPAGRLSAVLHVDAIQARDPLAEARARHGTDDPTHPGVAYAQGQPPWAIHGAVERLAPASAALPGFIVWFTGLSGAGKSTLATALARRLRSERRTEILDGDEVRTHLSRGLGFSKEDRDINVHRIGFVARTLAKHGVGVITAAISPYAETRRAVRDAAAQLGIAVIEVFADASLATVARRDVKGLYRQALAGEVPSFTGVSDPYEPPSHPDVWVRTDREGVAESVAIADGVDRIVAALWARGLVRRRPDDGRKSS